jgi:hypothetical protein
MWKISSASSTAPSIFAVPPVSTMPPAIMSSKPLRRSLGLHQREQLVVARLDHFGQRLARELPRGAVADPRHLDDLIAPASWASAQAYGS